MPARGWILTLLLAATVAVAGRTDPPRITRVWLTHRSPDPGKIVVNWETDRPGPSVVRYGTTPAYGSVARSDTPVTLHHVEIPLHRKGGVYHYRVETGDAASADATFKAYPEDRLRVAVAANWPGTTDLGALEREDVHLLLTGGDHISNLWNACGAGVKDCTKPFGQLVDRFPTLFRSTPFMPVLGNHDREIRPRGPKPPAEPVYDIEATAYRRFFELPADEWKWHFDVPEFGVRFVALDFNHLSDQGTTWQTCHPLGKDSEQYAWYRDLMEKTRTPFVVTLYNERHATVRAQAGGDWGRMISRGTLAITGFGHFAERAEVDGCSYYNTALVAGARYPDPHSRFLAGEKSYLVLTFEKNPRRLTVEVKRLHDGAVLHRNEHHPRTTPE